MNKKPSGCRLSQAQIAQLFHTSADNISLHLKNIFAEQELDESATTEDFSVVRQEGRRQVTRRLKHYNLDAVLSVGYRVKSKSATQFRIWATTRLKEYLLQGYTLNRKRLQRRIVKPSATLLQSALHKGSSTASICVGGCSMPTPLSQYIHQNTAQYPDVSGNIPVADRWYSRLSRVATADTAAGSILDFFPNQKIRIIIHNNHIDLSENEIRRTQSAAT